MAFKNEDCFLDVIPQENEVGTPLKSEIEQQNLCSYLEYINQLIDIFKTEPLQNFFKQLHNMGFNHNMKVLIETEKGLLKEMARSMDTMPLRGLYPTNEFFKNDQEIESLDHERLEPKQEFDATYMAHPLHWKHNEPKSLVLIPHTVIEHESSRVLSIIVNILHFIAHHYFKEATDQKQKKNEQEFVSFASHQLKVPLASFKSGLDMLKRQKFGELDWRS